MLLNIRGTNGSGKTTVATSLLEPGAGAILMATQTVPAPIKTNPDRMRERQVWGTPGLYDSIVLGTYKKSCGGCDEFSWKGSHDGMVDAILWGMQRYKHVIFEGLTVTSSFQRYVSLAALAKQNMDWSSHWIMLQVPLEECLRRVGARNGREVTERMIHNVTKKNDTVTSTIRKLVELPPGGPLSFSAHDTTESAQKSAHAILQSGIK